GALASAGFTPALDARDVPAVDPREIGADEHQPETMSAAAVQTTVAPEPRTSGNFKLRPAPEQARIGFAAGATDLPSLNSSDLSRPRLESQPATQPQTAYDVEELPAAVEPPPSVDQVQAFPDLPPLDSAMKLVREVAVESVNANIRPLGQLDESFIIATDEEGLLLIDQHVAHERILFDKYRALETARRSESQQMLIPETFDLTPAQAAAFDTAAEELEAYGFELMRLSGRTVAIKSTPADLPASEARNVLAEVLETVDDERRGTARETLRDEIAASLACHAAIKVNMPLAPEKMRWLIDRLLMTSSPTTCPHGRPVILRLATQDILKGFHRV